MSALVAVAVVSDCWAGNKRLRLPSVVGLRGPVFAGSGFRSVGVHDEAYSKDSVLLDVPVDFGVGCILLDQEAGGRRGHRG